MFEACNLLVSYTKTEAPRREARDRPTDRDRGTEIAIFAQATTQGIVQCYNCQETGHYANSCTNPARTRAQGIIAPAGPTFLVATNEEEEDKEDNEETMFSINMTDKSVRRIEKKTSN